MADRTKTREDEQQRRTPGAQEKGDRPGQGDRERGGKKQGDKKQGDKKQGDKKQGGKKQGDKSSSPGNR